MRIFDKKMPTNSLEFSMKKLIVLMSIILSFSTMAADYSCFGTEPFWGLKLTNESVEFSSPMDDSVATEAVASKTNAIGYADDFAFIVKTDKGSLASVTTGECSDGMSDNVYSKHITYVNGDNVFYGCCNEIVKK